MKNKENLEAVEIEEPQEEVQEEQFDEGEEIKEIDEEALKEDEDEDEETKKLNSQIREFESSQTLKFGKVDNKHEFASEVINIDSIKKCSNLDIPQIIDLCEKRQFVNNLLIVGWNKVAEILEKTITDVEAYSLSKDGFLVKNVLVDHSKQSNFNVEKLGDFKK